MTRKNHALRRVLAAWMILGTVMTATAADWDAVMGKMVKIYGLGGVAGLEEYQTGTLISREGHLVTAFTPALDTDEIRCVLANGDAVQATLVGFDPALEIALLKLEKPTAAFFDLAESAQVAQDGDIFGAEAFAVSNLFGVATGNENVSVQKCRISTKTTLNAARGIVASRYGGPIFVVDVATNNPGAAGGALVSADGETLYGILGKELQHAETSCWLNFAIPADVVRQSVADIFAGRAGAGDGPSEGKLPEKTANLGKMGVLFVPEVFAVTPPYVDWVEPGSVAAQAGVMPDDLILQVNGQLVQSIGKVGQQLRRIDFRDPVRLTILRGEAILELELTPREE